jgi:hypothetical protein
MNLYWRPFYLKTKRANIELQLKIFCMSKKIKKKTNSSVGDEKFPLPIYKNEDDIYNRQKEEPLENEDNPGMRRLNNKNKNLGEGLDIPGAELDDLNEEIGEEDEENNYYSLGGDDHKDLETDQGD